MKVLYPTLRFFELTWNYHDFRIGFDENYAPTSLCNYTSLPICVFLVPGETWNNAINQLGPNNPIEIRDSVQILNGAWNGNKLIFTYEYNMMNVDECSKWLDKAILELSIKSH